jgi:hypothetical protein
MNIIEQNMVKPNKIRTNYKYPESFEAHNLEINYNKLYYDKNRKYTKCSICGSLILNSSTKKHLASEKCINYSKNYTDTLCITL